MAMRDDDLISIDFINANKPIQLDNRQDIQGSIETLYTKNDKDVILLTYHKIDSTILLFIIITGCCWSLILACFIYKQAF